MKQIASSDNPQRWIPIKQYWTTVIALVAAFSFLDTSNPVFSFLFFREVITNLLMNGAITVLVLIVINSFAGVGCKKHE